MKSIHETLSSQSGSVDSKGIEILPKTRIITKKLSSNKLTPCLPSLKNLEDNFERIEEEIKFNSPRG